MADNLEAPEGAPGATEDQHQNSGPINITSATSDSRVVPYPMWTPGRVEERLRKAAALQAELRAERPVADRTARRVPESRSIIGGIGDTGSDDSLVAHAAEALVWLRWLEPDDAALVCARLAGAPWKSLCWRFGISRPTADRRWRYALALIAWHLNGYGRAEGTPSLRSLLGMRRNGAGARSVPSMAII